MNPPRNEFIDQRALSMLQNTTAIPVGVSGEKLQQGGISSALFKLVKNRIPTRVSSKLVDAHRRFSSQVDLSASLGGVDDMGTIALDSSYGRYSVSTENFDEQVPSTPPPVYRSKSSLQRGSTPASSLIDESSSSDDSDVEAIATGLKRRKVYGSPKRKKSINTSFVAGASSGVKVGFANQGEF
jgi:hypothetical protein